MNIGFSRLLCILWLGMMLAGCEARLDLSKVRAEMARPTHRLDLFQAIARHRDEVIVVGGMGAVVQSFDGGESWRRSILPGKPFLVDVAVCPDGGFHAIEKTDGLWSLGAGGGWTRQALPDMTEPQAMTCDGANVLWVTGGFGTILHSANAGAEWTTWSLQEDLYLTTIQFLNARHGVATGEFGTVLMTADGGATWTRADDLPGDFYPQSAHFITPDKGWVVGLNGTIWATDSAGASWQREQSSTSAPLYTITGSGGTLVAVGENTTILYKEPGDASWYPINSSVASHNYLRGIAGFDNGRFIIAGGGGVLLAVTVPGSGVNPIARAGK